MALRTTTGAATLVEYLLNGVKRDLYGGDLFREEQARCYSMLVGNLKAWGAAQGVGRVLMGLSGGLDSAVVAVVAARAFGAGNVLTVFMPSAYTSAMSGEDAAALARNLGVEMLTLPIDGLRAEASRVLAGVGGGDGLWAENVQARLRAVLLMAVSNRRGHVLLNTSNRSEILVGYSTLYGDTCGAVSVLGDLYKTEVTSLARWINDAQRDVIPERIITRPPSAELRDNQRDEDSLPRYDELDCLLTEMMGEVFETNVFMLDSELERVEAMRERVAALVARNQFKRAQLPPVLKVYGRSIPGRIAVPGIEGVL